MANGVYVEFEPGWEDQVSMLAKGLGVDAYEVARQLLEQALDRARLVGVGTPDREWVELIVGCPVRDWTECFGK